MKIRYSDTKMQAAYENAYDCLYYGMGRSVWNNCGLDKEASMEVWQQAFYDICSEE